MTAQNSLLPVRKLRPTNTTRRKAEDGRFHYQNLPSAEEQRLNRIFIDNLRLFMGWDELYPTREQADRGDLPK